MSRQLGLPNACERPRTSDEPTARMVCAHLSRTVRHKWWVFVAGAKLATTVYPATIESWWRLLVHDLSIFVGSSDSGEFAMVAGIA